MRISCMETQMGLMMIGPRNQSLRILRGNPAYVAGRDILHGALPAEQKWQMLTDLVNNPLKALVDWCERFGFTFKDEGDILSLNDVKLKREHWLPMFNRMQTVGGSPKHLLQFAEKLGAEAQSAQVANATLHLQDDKLLGYKTALLLKVGLPKAARTGDIVNESSTGTVPFLVSYHDFAVNPDGTLKPLNGLVLSQVSDESEVADILVQPVVLGFNRTYRCEEGTPEGWLEDLSFDSLNFARRNAKEIQDTGAEARIINRITGEAVALN